MSATLLEHAQTKLSTLDAQIADARTQLSTLAAEHDALAEQARQQSIEAHLADGNPPPTTTSGTIATLAADIQALEHRLGTLTDARRLQATLVGNAQKQAQAEALTEARHRRHELLAEQVPLLERLLAIHGELMRLGNLGGAPQPVLQLAEHAQINKWLSAARAALGARG